MAAGGRQGAPKDKAHGNVVNNKAEQEKVQRLHQNKASEPGSETSEFEKKEAVGGLEATPGVHTDDCILTCSPSREANWPEIQDLAPDSLNADCSPGKRTSVCNYFSGPVTQIDPLPQIYSQPHLTLHTSTSQSQSGSGSGHMVSAQHSSNTATSRSHHQQNSNFSLNNRNSSTSQDSSWQNSMGQAPRAVSTLLPRCDSPP